MDEKNMIGGVVVLLLAVGAILFAVSGGSGASKVASQPAPAGALELAQCLKDSGATFYGAFWCPHCQKQKDEFGSAASALPYVECSTPDGNGQTALCAAKKVESYPTWDFKDGTRVTGELSFEQLAQKSGCPLPGLPVALPAASGTPSAAPAPLSPQ